MPTFEKGNTHGKGRPKGSGYVQRCTSWADKKGWKLLERIAEGKRPLDPKEEKAAIKAEGKENDPKEKGRGYSVTNDLPNQKLQFYAIRTLIEYGKGKPRISVDLEAGTPGESTVFGILGQAYLLNQERDAASSRSSKRSKKAPSRRR